MKKLFAITALALGVGMFSSEPAFADRYWDGHGWRERHNVIVEREYYHGPRYYRPYHYHPYNTYVEPVYVAPQPVYYAAPPVVYQPAPVARINVRF